MVTSVSFAWTDVSGNFFVNDPSVGDQGNPAVVGLSGGGYFVTWDEPNAVAIYGRIVDADGTLSDQFQVNNVTAVDDQFEASIALLNDGNVVVTFTNTQLDPGGNIYARLFTEDGPVNFDFPVVADGFDDTLADVAALDDGGFVVTWSRDFGAGNVDIRSTIFEADGTIRTSLVFVTSSGANSSFSSVAGLTGGDHVVVWQEEPAAGGDESVWFRRFDENGMALDDDPVLIDTTGSLTNDIQVVALQDGGFAIAAYAEDGFGFDGTDIVLQIFDEDGSDRTLPILVNEVADGAQSQPSLTVLSNGYLVVGWANAGVLTYQAYTPQGIPVESNYPVASGIVEAEITGLTNGTIANVRASTQEEAAGFGDSIRSSMEALVRTTTSDGASDTLTGDDLIDVMFGNGGNDTLNGFGADDTLNGGAGADAMAGGNGNDTYVVDNAGDTTVEATGQGNDTVQSSLTRALSANVENLTLTGGAAINGSGNGLDNALTGNSAANTLTGFAGNDALNGRAGADAMTGGLGNDTYIVDNAGDTTVETGSSGVDTVQSSVTRTLSADVENLTLTGGAAINGTGNGLANTISGNSAANVVSGLGANDTLTSFGGNDLLNGGIGADGMTGGLGDDTYVVDSAGDTTVEASGGGADTVQSTVTFTLSANVETLVLNGAAAINGTGNGSANTMYGNSAVNRLDGNGGTDTMTGFGGADRFVFDDGDGADVVIDFQNGSDKFDLTAVAGIDDIGDLTIVDNGSTVTVNYGSGSFTISNVGNPAVIDASDFVL